MLRGVSTRAPLLCLLAAILTPAASCGEPAGPEPAEGETLVLFVGNSLTASNNLPGMVATVAQASGHPLATVSILRGGAAIEDHWYMGLPDRIRSLRPDVVVLQQGPSSLPESRVNLRAWTDSVARVAREVGASTALLMVWPELQRYYAFGDVRRSYELAARDVGGVFIPAGEAFRALHEAHPRMEPYGSDGFHPSRWGTVISAFVVVRALFGEPVRGLPAEMRPASGDLPVIVLDPAQALVLQTLADSVVAALPATAPPGR